MRSAVTRVTRRVRPELFDQVVYTDGACKGNPGPGGWGCVGFEKSLSEEAVTFARCGGSASTTNNRMELLAVIEALSALTDPAYQVRVDENRNRPPTVLFVVDSKYVLQGVTEWAENWVRRNWIKPDGQPVANSDLWKKLLALTDQFAEMTWCWVKGHSDDFGNEFADRLANRGYAEHNQQEELA